jgi:hypothetical protein
VWSCRIPSGDNTGELTGGNFQRQAGKDDIMFVAAADPTQAYRRIRPWIAWINT